MKKAVFLIAAALCASTAALAGTPTLVSTHTFETYATGGAGASPPIKFATLSILQDGADALFELSFLSPSPFGESSKLSALWMNTSISAPGLADAQFVSGGVSVKATDKSMDKPMGFGGGQDRLFDYKVSFMASERDKFAPGEAVIFRVPDAPGAAFVETMSVHVQAGAAGYSAKATTPIPEPGSYALMLAGLAVVGMIARRRIG